MLKLSTLKPKQEVAIRSIQENSIKPMGYPSVSVLICTLNEEKNIPYVLPKIPLWVDEILLVDGNSRDRTIEIAKQICPRVKVLYQPGKGKGNALKYGIQKATGEIIVMMDADGSTDPDELLSFINPLVNGGYDFVKGSRFLPGGDSLDMPWYRRLGNKLFTLIIFALFGRYFTDLCYGYNAFWKNKYNLIELRCDGFEIETEMHVKTLKANLNVLEVPSIEYRRIDGDGKLESIKDGWRILRTIINERFRS